MLPIPSGRDICQTLRVSDELYDSWVEVSVANNLMLTFLHVERLYILRAQARMPYMIIKDMSFVEI